ncbi:MAG: protein kinase [Myxococcota bacterium]
MSSVKHTVELRRGSGRTTFLDVGPESRLLDALQSHGSRMLAACGGNGLCATCHVRLSGPATSVSPKTKREELTLATLAHVSSDSRLACQVVVFGPDVVVGLKEGEFIDKVLDIEPLVGKRTTRDILHPVTGGILVEKGRLITRTRLRQLEEAERKGELKPRPIKKAKSRAQRWSTMISDADTNYAVVSSSKTAAGNRLSGERMQADFSLEANRSREESTLRRFGPGERIGRFTLQELMRETAASVTFRSFHESLAMTVAVKIFKGIDETPSRCLEEMRRLASLDHPNIVRVLDADSKPSMLVFEHVAILSLAELVEASGPLPVRRALELALDVANGLAAACEKGVIHRALCPHTVMVRKDGRSQVTDFALGSISTSADANDAGYQAPETTSAPQRSNERSDMYSLGATLLYALTGKAPEDAWTLVISSPGLERSQRSHTTPVLPSAMKQFIRRLMEASQSDRFESWSQVTTTARAALADLLERAQPIIDSSEASVEASDRWSVASVEGRESSACRLPTSDSQILWS